MIQIEIGNNLSVTLAITVICLTVFMVKLINRK